MIRRAWPWALACVLLAAPSSAAAFESFVSQVPCHATATNSVGTERPCITCHNNPDGGSGCTPPPEHCLNPFGMAFLANGTTWDMTLALMDSDSDGYTNGEELGDAMGAWSIGMPSPGTCGCATRPGFPDSTPADAESDHDGYCCRGHDATHDGDCLDSGEHDGSFDCDDSNAEANSAAAEICSNPVDDDCDGLPTILDPDCASVLDRDGDGFCPTGRDDNGNGNCIDAGEATADSDCDDSAVTVFPDAPENCIDGLDNNCDGFTDTDDPTCTGEMDADNDGYCPIGRDLNDNGNCLDPDEDTAGFDCNDHDDAVNPDQSEICTDAVDNDCDGLADFRDETCREFFDADGDGYCPAGRDADADQDCVDDGETDDPGDCDDDDAAINPGHAEVCTNEVDDDCDALISLADPDCATYLDGDHDRYCTVGYDTNGDHDCADEGEPAGASDCDDANAEVGPEATELCTNGVDDDCDGSTDAFDSPTCDDYRDRDGDGWCAIGRDLDDDGDCSDEGEAQEPNDAGHDEQPTVYPGAPENCFDRLDNDLNGVVDDADVCTRDADADGDGYCAIGQDVNGDGDCLDDGENIAVSDCAPDDADVHPGAPEACRENVDHDCDGDIGLLDSDCYYLLDRDHDGFCGMGIDDDNDGSCLDEAEDRGGRDCDDGDAIVNPRAAEVCDDAIDNDCNGLTDHDDPACPCDSDAICDDGDPCTRDTCSNAVCEHASDSACGDAGPPTPPPPGCGCRVGGTENGGIGWALIAVAVGLLLWRRRAVRAAPWLAAVLAVSSFSSVAYAFPAFRDRAPQGYTFGDGSSGPGCMLCHVNEEGGGGCSTRPCLNPFGHDFDSTTGGRTFRMWDAWLRDRDSDRDGRTNGQELIYFGAVYPDASFEVGDFTLATDPGDPASRHTDECALQADATFGVSEAPDNYTNCAADAEVVCTNTSSDTAVPANTRYFGFTCGCAADYVGNGRREVAGDGVADGAANGCTLVDPCLAAATCSDTDECATAGTCGSHGTGCTNLLGSYQCACEPGYAAPATGGACADIDECALDNPCAPGACTNTDGGYTCSDCPLGFMVSGGRCVDVNECGASTCGPGLCLENDPGHYTCTRCGTGYSAPALDGTCADVNECATPGTCATTATCTNTPGSFTCECNDGYEGPGNFCNDVDDCLSNPCDENATCINTEGSFYCQCPVGYRRVGLACEDIDECLEGTALCQREEVCVNHVGAPYECACAPGFARETPTSRCEPSCGDGARGAGEECDDGNDASGDGCADCRVEPGFVCYEPDGGASSCEATCGDGLVEPEAHEECDQGDANSDTAANACRTRCVRASCGDGVVDDGEECDDANANSDEVAGACRTDCHPAHCGDGVLDDGEMCDPGGGALDPATCMQPCETGGTCSAAPSGSAAGGLALLVGLLALVIRRRR